jgi:hypothetical protein
MPLAFAKPPFALAGNRRLDRRVRINRDATADVLPKQASALQFVGRNLDLTPERIIAASGANA